MYKLVFTLICLLNVFVTLQSQEDNGGFDLTKKTYVNRIKQKNITPYIGFPYIEKWLFKMVFDEELKQENLNYTKVNYGGLNPIGIRFDYFFSKNLSYGFDLFYNYYFVELIDTYEYFDFPSQSTKTQTDIYKFQTERYRAHLRLNYHFNVENPMKDIYIGAGGGLNFRRYNFTINGEKDLEANQQIKDSALVFPFSSRICFGYKHYFTNHFGVSGEVGIGGPLFSFGIDLKF